MAENVNQVRPRILRPLLDVKIPISIPNVDPTPSGGLNKYFLSETNDMSGGPPVVALREWTDQRKVVQVHCISTHYQYQNMGMKIAKSIKSNITSKVHKIINL